MAKDAVRVNRAPCVRFRADVGLWRIDESMEHTFTDANFEAEVLKSPTPVLVDFWAPWCAPCRMTGPIIEELANEIDGSRLKIGKVNVDENGALAQTYGILSIPSFLVFQNGNVADRFVGGMPKEGFMDKLAKYLG